MVDFNVNDIAEATRCDPQNITQAFSLLDAAFKKHGVTHINTVIGILATAATETRYRSIDEIGNSDKYHGRGYGQLTGAENYKKYGQLVGIDLLNQPELAKVPATAAEILVIFFQETGCAVWSERANWRKVRKIYNGGLNGWDAYQLYVYNLIDLFYKEHN